MSRGRALRTGIAYDARSGLKVRGRKLVSDGERPGIYTERSWADQRHPARFVRVPPPDGLTYRPGPPAAHSIGARVDLSWVMASDTSYGATDQGTQQAFGVLHRLPAPRLFAYLNPSSMAVIAIVADDLAAQLLATAALSANLHIKRNLQSSLAATATLTAALTVIGLNGQWDFTDSSQSAETLTAGIL